VIDPETEATMEDVLTLYDKGQLIGAAIRLHQHSKGTPPSPDQIAEALQINVEQVHHTINKMADLGAVLVMEGAYGSRVLLADHHKIDDLEGKDAAPGIDDEVAAFQEAQAKKNEALAARFGKDYVDPQKAELKADLDSRLADKSGFKRADNPLDAMFKKKD
jgi:hypothetical protein